MKLNPTPESIVPEQSVIDSWPQMHRKKTTHACQDKCPEFKDEQCGHCLVQQDACLIKEIVFDAEAWIYERKNKYPMVDCIPLAGEGLWKTFGYHPVCSGVTLQDEDVIILNTDGNYTVRPKVAPILQNADEAKFYGQALSAEGYVP